MTPVLLTLAGIIGIVVLAWRLFFPMERQRIIERSARIEREPLTIVEIPIAAATQVHIWVELGSLEEKVELWDPNGNLIATEFPQDKRNPLDKISYLISGRSLIYRVDFSLWQPMEGQWEVKIFKAPEEILYYFDLYADVTSNFVLKVELGEPRMVGDDKQIPIMARLYKGNELICDENLQIDVEIEVRRSDPPKTHSLQSDSNCVFTGSTGLLTLRDTGFYVVANYGFVRRQQFFYT